MSVLIISQPVANVFEMLLHRRDSLPEAGYFIYMEARAFPVADHFCSREALVSIPAVGHGALHRRALLTARGPSCIKGGNAQCAARSRMGETRAGSPPTDGTAGTKKDPYSWPNSKEMAPRSWPFLARNNFTWNAVRGRPRGAPCLVAQRGEANKGEATILWRRVQPCGATWGGE